MSNTPFRAWFQRIASLMLVMALLIGALPAEAKKKSSAEYAKVKVSVAKMYKSTKNKKQFIRLKKGTVVVVAGVHGKWAKVKARGHVGFVLTKKLVKVKSKAASKVAAAFSVSDKAIFKRRALKKGSTGEDVAELQRRLIELGFLKQEGETSTVDNASIRAVRRFQVINAMQNTGKISVLMQKRILASAAKRLPAIDNASWNDSDINRKLPDASFCTVVDVNTGLRFRAQRLFGTNHLDLEPATRKDTKRLKQMYGGKWSWDSRAVLLIVGGKYYAGAINSVPHGKQRIRNNGYPGQFCLHLKDCKTHGSNKVNVEHQKSIQHSVDYFTAQ